MKEDKIANIKIKQNMLESTLQHKKLLRQLHMKKHWELSNDLHRRKLISFKKLIQFKTDRLRRNITRLQANRAEKVREKEIISWKKRLMERVENQEKIHQLMKEVDRQRRTFIEEHKSKYKTKWQLIEKEIRTRSQHNRRKFRNKISNEDSASCQVSGNTPTNGTDFQEIFDRLLEGDICKALNTALDLGANIKVPFDANDPIYKAAQFIMQHILTKLDKDLSNDKEAFQSVYERVDHFFAEAKKFVIFVSKIAWLPSLYSRDITFYRDQLR